MMHFICTACALFTFDLGQRLFLQEKQRINNSLIMAPHEIDQSKVLGGVGNMNKWNGPNNEKPYLVLVFYMLAFEREGGQ